jgi:hypothetical protein
MTSDMPPVTEGSSDKDGESQGPDDYEVEKVVNHNFQNVTLLLTKDRKIFRSKMEKLPFLTEHMGAAKKFIKLPKFNRRLFYTEEIKDKKT